MSDALGSVLVGDMDADFRASMINHLLLSGVADLDEVSTATEAADRLSRRSFDLIILDHDLFRIPEIRRHVERVRCEDHSSVIVLVDDDSVGERAWRLVRSDVVLCVGRSAARKILTSWAASAPPRSPR